MKKNVKTILSSTLVPMGVLLGSLVSGCMTGQNQSTFDAILGSSQNYVEAFIEYKGPQERWAGPANWVMHVSARDSGAPQVVIPTAWTPTTVSPNVRKPASQGLTAEVARARLTTLAAAMNENDSGYKGCMYPIHVRLVRSDGGILDEQGCRDQSHWAKTASETVDFFVASVK